jgi:putative intracellular protease/amidase
MPGRGKIGVLIEEHFDPTEYRRFNEYFPGRGYAVEYLSHLWGQPQLRFHSNPTDGVVEEEVTVRLEVDAADPADYAAILLIGGYAMDRLRYQPKVTREEPNQAPAVRFLRRVLRSPDAKVGSLCHGLWLFCADPTLLRGRRVTCAHNIICDVENAGGEVVYAGDETADVVVDGNLISAKHPAVIDRFLTTLVEEIERPRRGPGHSSP